jgi:hypothetical protein
MVMQLVVIAGPDEGLTIELDRENGTRLGRSQSILTHLTDPHVSRVHAELHVQEGQVLVADSNSAGGTFVNGRRVGRQALRPGDIIQVGATQLRFDNTEGRVEQTTLAPGALGRPATSTEELTGLTGQMLGRYEIGPILSRGKSSCVFRAKDTADGRTVALKVLHPEFTQDDEDMQRFVRAMKTMLPLRHPNLVQIENAGRTGTYCWVAMEFVEGESLRQVIERIGVAGMLDWRHAIRIGIHIGRALEYAHGQQIIHRNVTPANILIRSSDQVAKLADLMLAKALEGALAQPITRPGELLGDLNYMSPERTRGTAEIGRHPLRSSDRSAAFPWRIPARDRFQDPSGGAREGQEVSAFDA